MPILSKSKTNMAVLSDEYWGNGPSLEELAVHMISEELFPLPLSIISVTPNKKVQMLIYSQVREIMVGWSLRLARAVRNHQKSIQKEQV